MIVAGGEHDQPDTQAIANLVYSYAERLDLGDFKGVADLFSHATFRAILGDAIDVHEGADAVLKVFNRLVATYGGSPRTKHVTTNLIIEVDEHGDFAGCRSYFSVLQSLEDFPLQVVISGRYHDSFERVNGKWRFADRLIFSEFMGDLSRHMKRMPS
ncbi:MAG: nuclear transport factor 2 family protein [Acidimicrobiales bacterium]